jgi:hypothetical protein
MRGQRGRRRDRSNEHRGLDGRPFRAQHGRLALLLRFTHRRESTITPPAWYRGVVMRLAWVILVGLTASVAYADDSAGETPWSQGVSDENKAKAQVLLDAGNQLFVDNRFAEALEKYQAAVALWDHPAIRFNIVRALIGLDRPVEAAENLEQSLRYGKAPLTDAIYAEARAYQKLLAGQIANVQISCAQSGAKISLDGATFLDACPGTKRARLRPGKHLVVGELAGHLTKTLEVLALPAQEESIDVKLIDLSHATVSRRHWDVWKPWAIAGGGAALAALGGLLQWRAAADMDQYEATLALECPAGCDPGEVSPSTGRLESRAVVENRIAIGAMITGGAVAAAGIALVVLNRPREVLDDAMYRREAERTSVTALISDQAIGVGVRGAF